jgi:hypothetical protein
MTENFKFNLPLMLVFRAGPQLIRIRKILTCRLRCHVKKIKVEIIF